MLCPLKDTSAYVMKFEEEMHFHEGLSLTVDI